MFGHNDSQTNEDTEDTTVSTVMPTDQVDDTSTSMPVVDSSTTNQADDDDMTSAIDALASETTNSDASSPVESSTTPEGATSTVDDVPTSDSSDDSSENDAAGPESEAPAASPTPANNDELLNLKREALEDLAPLVDHLDQSPEEKFKTTMMMIQATDDSSMVKQAYEAATSITDEKIRAQALLDIVNEINYFTQQQSS
jgi:hypothetical protein